MRTLKTVFILMAVILMSSLVLTCEKDNDKTVATDNEVSFAINVSNLKSASILKSAMDYNLADADKIILTILNSDGSPTKYTSSEVKIQQMNGDYYTQKIVLKTGDYNLTEFIILNSADSTIFATPLTGSQEAQNVSNSLPNAFSVAKDVTTPVNVEVLSAEKKTPEDFGLSLFPIIEVKTFGFMIGVADIENDRLLSTQITVSNGDYSYVQNLDSITNNVVTVKDGLSNYKLTVEKLGYKTYEHTYPIDSMKMFRDTIGNLPLLIELEKLTVTDYDGNIYKTVVIGNQVWMAENLKTSHFRNGEAIPEVIDQCSWNCQCGGHSATAAFCYYNNDINNNTLYGKLYNWYAVVDSRNICPSGWHIPTGPEWSTLINYLGGESVAGGKLKESGTVLWNNPNTGATNESNFAGLPGGSRQNDGNFYGIGNEGRIWSSFPDDGLWAYFLYITYNSAGAGMGHQDKSDGYSVRCIKD